jgi:hypothetical protein
MINYKQEKANFDTTFVWDVVDELPGSYISKLAKENRISEELAKIWNNYYVAWMIHYSRNLNMEPEQYLALPYEVLQVWRLHVLYTRKYNELSLKLTVNKVKFLPFLPANSLWRTSPPETIHENFLENKKLFESFGLFEQSKLDRLFNFSNAYIRNSLVFSLEEGSEVIERITKLYKEKLIKLIGTTELKNFTDLKNFVSRLRSLLNLQLLKKRISPPGPSQKKLTMIMNL